MATIKPTQLYRSDTDRFLGGVCGGIAEYFHLDSTLIRLLFIASILLGGSGILVYLILWLVIPTAKQASIMEAAMAKVKNSSTDHPLPADRARNNKFIWGLLLIGIGTLMLLENFGVGRYLMLDKTWPAIFVILGLIILSR